MISTCGCTCPTVPTCFASGVPSRVWVLTGLVSVIPYAMATSLMCIALLTCFITSTGHGDPAMIPVRRLDRS